MGKIKDITGTMFGRLHVIGLVGVDKWRDSLWRCVCDCGKEVVVGAGRLRSGSIKSCGCDRDVRRKRGVLHKSPIGEGKAAFNRVYGYYKRNAKTKGVGFELDKEEFKKLTQGSCFYCGVYFSRTSRAQNNHGDFKYNGIDRVDNNRGYEIGNVVSCCTECNYLKGDKDYQDFINWIGRAAKNLKLKGILP